MLLAIDTCGPLGGVAFGEAEAGSVETQVSFANLGHPQSWSRELAGKTYSERLLSTVEELLREADIRLDGIAGVVVVRGPGSFTGIRIGVSAAKGLAEGLGIPLIALSRLKLLARKPGEAEAVAVLDAGRGEFYTGFYRQGVCETEVLLTRDALSQAVSGSGAAIVVCEQEVFSALDGLGPIFVTAPTAVEALAAGAERFRAGEFDDAATLEANYVRRSESEIFARAARHAALKGRPPQAAAVAE
jgi:tRNA threonylcarbamoyladenosine biosynthesis protein TsaB